MVKLNQKRIKWLVRQVIKEGRKPSEICFVYKITPRRIQQLVKYFKDTGKMPELSKQRRPRIYLSDEQKDIINKTFEKTRLSARLLYYEIKAREKNIPKNKIYAYLKEQNKIIPDPKKQKKRKRCRYEREHSGSLVHLDWHRTSIQHPYCILYEDDASRKILAGQEFKSLSAKKTVDIGKEAIQEANKLNVLIHAFNMDHDSTFTADEFMNFMKETGIKPVFSRIKNPQTNGKLERLWYEYDKHRWRFSNLKEWIDWYNNRLHGALKLDWAETPNQAFQRKLRPECLIGMMFK